MLMVGQNGEERGIKRLERPYLDRSAKTNMGHMKQGLWNVYKLLWDKGSRIYCDRN